jgi:hypothetical protein
MMCPNCNTEKPWTSSHCPNCTHDVGIVFGLVWNAIRITITLALFVFVMKILF